jgi:predicted MFS family arabinose efflux permease
MNVIFMGIYLVANNSFGFLVGKFAEGVRNASLWSVNRAYFMDHSFEKKDILIKMRGLGSIFSAFGTIAAGILLSLLFFEKTIIVCIIVSIFIIPQVFRLKDKMRRDVSMESFRKSFDIRGRRKVFKDFIVIFVFMGIAFGLTAGYVLPLFLRLIGYNEQTIGLLLGARTLCTGLITYFLASRVAGKRLVLYGGLAFALAMALMVFATEQTALAIIILIGLADGLVSANFEYIFVKIVNQKSSAGDIAQLMFGFHMGMSGSLAISGFVISALGFNILFIGCALLFAVTSVASYYSLTR